MVACRNTTIRQAAIRVRKNHSLLNNHIMHFPFFHPGGPRPAGNKDILVPLHEQEYNTSEGGEFLDDAIRTDDEPSGEPVKSSDIVRED